VVTLGDATVTMQSQRSRGGWPVWQNQSVAWLHGRVMLVAKVSGLAHQADWSLLPRFAEALDAAYLAYQESVGSG
jgi:hypothetical protein